MEEIEVAIPNIAYANEDIRPEELGIPKYMAEEIIKMSKNMADEFDQPLSEVNELSLKKIVSINDYIAADAVIPIVTHLNNLVLQYKKRYFYGGRHKYNIGLSEENKQILSALNQIPKTGLKVNFDKPIKVSYINIGKKDGSGMQSGYYILPPEIEIDIVGLEVRKKLLLNDSVDTAVNKNIVETINKNITIDVAEKPEVHYFDAFHAFNNADKIKISVGELFKQIFDWALIVYRSRQNIGNIAIMQTKKNNKINPVKLNINPHNNNVDLPNYITAIPASPLWKFTTKYDVFTYNFDKEMRDIYLTDKLSAENKMLIDLRIGNIKMQLQNMEKENENFSTRNLYAYLIEKTFGVKRLDQIKISGNILESLTEKESTVIKNAAKQWVTKYRESLNNKCEHKSAYTFYREEPFNKKAEEGVNKFRGDTKDGIIMCKVCNYPLMCTHLHDFYKLYNETHKIMKQGMSKFIITNDEMTYYCKYCGEILAKESDFAQVGHGDLAQDRETSDYIWNEVFVIQRRVSKNQLIDTKAFVTSIKNSLYNVVMDIDKNIDKAKINNPDESKSKRKIYVNIIIYVYLVKIMSETNDIYFTDIKPFKPQQEYTKKLMGWAHDRIMQSMNVYISKVLDLNAEVIKRKMIEYYKMFAEDITRGTISYSESSASEFINNIYNDSIFNYYLSATRILDGKIDKKTREEQIEKVLGDDIHNLNKSKYSPYKKIKNSGLAGKLASINKTKLSSIKDIHPRLSNHYVAAFKKFDEGDGVLSAEEKLDIESTRQFITSIRKPTYDEINKVRPDKNQYIAKENLARIYDENGNVHKWKYNKCTICGVARADVGKLSAEKIKVALHKKFTIDNLLRFYENICPASNELTTHTFENSICTKCNLGSLSADEYYDTYIDVYNKKLDTLKKMHEKNNEEIAHMDEEQITKYKNINWIYDYNSVLNLCNTFKLNNKLISAMGAMWRKEYTDIEYGVIIEVSTSKLDTRIYVLIGYIRNLIVEYNQLKWYNNIPNPRYSHKKLIDESNIDKYRLGDLSALMQSKDVDDKIFKFNAEITSIQHNRKSQEIVEYCIQSFCDLLLEINKPVSSRGTTTGKTEKDIVQLRYLFVRHIISATLNSDELTTKAGYFNWSMIYGNKMKKIEVEDSSNLMIDDGGDVIDSSEVGGMLENNFDMEEVDDPDNDDNGQNVEDDYGMD